MNATKHLLSTMERAGDHVSSVPDWAALPRGAIVAYRAGAMAYMLWGVLHALVALTALVSADWLAYDGRKDQSVFVEERVIQRFGQRIGRRLIVLLLLENNLSCQRR